MRFRLGSLHGNGVEPPAGGNCYEACVRRGPVHCVTLYSNCYLHNCTQFPYTVYSIIYRERTSIYIITPVRPRICVLVFSVSVLRCCVSRCAVRVAKGVVGGGLKTATTTLVHCIAVLLCCGVRVHFPLS